MKILHVFTLPTTAEAFFDGQFAYLSENGYEITIIANSKINEDFSNRNRVRSKVISISRAISPISDIKSIIALWREIKRSNYDAVFGHTPKGALISMTASMLAGIKKRVYYRHGLVYTTASGFKRQLLKTVEQLVSVLSTHIINVSPSLCRLAVRDKLNTNKKQTVIGSGTCGGIDAQNIFNPDFVGEEDLNFIKNKFGIRPQDIVIGFCGRLCKDKGIRELIDGFRLFNKTTPNSKLLLVGAFDTRDVLPDSYKYEIQNNPNILYTGQIDKPHLFLYYSLMDVFVFPSYREGFGMSVIEASAMQIPILVSKSHGCVDSIKEHQTGEYIEVSSVGIANGLESILSDKKLIEYGINGRDWVLKNFDYKVMWPSVLQLYKTVIG